MEKLKNLRKILDAPVQVQLSAQTMVVKSDRACPAGPGEDGFIQLEGGTPPNTRFTLQTDISVPSLISLFPQQPPRPLGESEVPGDGGDAGRVVVPAQDRPRPVWTGRDFPPERPSYFHPLLPAAVFVLLQPGGDREQ